MAVQGILSKEVTDAGFRLSKDAPVAIFDQHLGDIDFATITPEMANQLVEAGCSYIIKTSKRSTPET